MPVQKEHNGNVEHQLPDKGQPEGHLSFSQSVEIVHHIKTQEHKRCGKAPGLQKGGSQSYGLRISDKGSHDFPTSHKIQEDTDHSDAKAQHPGPVEKGLHPFEVARGIVVSHQGDHSKADAYADV